MLYGDFVKLIRKKRGLYQIDIANAITCTVQAVSKYEANLVDIGIEYIDAICKRLSISINDFIAMNEEAPLSRETLSFSREKFVTYLLYLRQQKGFTQRELGEMVGLSHKKVSKWETGISLPSIEELQRLSEIYQLSPRDLYYVKAGIDYKKLRIRKKRGSSEDKNLAQ